MKSPFQCFLLVKTVFFNASFSNYTISLIFFYRFELFPCICCKKMTLHYIFGCDVEYKWMLFSPVILSQVWSLLFSNIKVICDAIYFLPKKFMSIQEPQSYPPIFTFPYNSKIPISYNFSYSVEAMHWYSFSFSFLGIFSCNWNFESCLYVTKPLASI